MSAAESIPKRSIIGLGCLGRRVAGLIAADHWSAASLATTWSDWPWGKRSGHGRYTRPRGSRSAQCRTRIVCSFSRTGSLFRGCKHPGGQTASETVDIRLNRSMGLTLPAPVRCLAMRVTLSIWESRGYSLVIKHKTLIRNPSPKWRGSYAHAAAAGQLNRQLVALLY